MILTVDTINNAYNELKSATIFADEKARIAADFEAILDSEKAIFVAEGKAVGENAEKRKACVESHFASGIAELRQKQNTAELARLELEMAQIEVSRVMALLRYMEFTSMEEMENLR